MALSIALLRQSIEIVCENTGRTQGHIYSPGQSEHRNSVCESIGPT